ncbi:hypothetical protein KM043_017721 [Ampulex compressa]|nr:hypothetical protein KM043_017721 [Ampulex compressa]
MEGERDKRHPHRPSKDPGPRQERVQRPGSLRGRKVAAAIVLTRSKMDLEKEISLATTIPKTSESVAAWVESAIVTAFQTSVGQTLLKLVDRFLWFVEKTAQWSLPCQEIAAEENGKTFGQIELIRPLPWVFFLPSLVILRAIRAGLNIGAFILRYPQIQPSGVVKFVQKSRRRLRALNLKAVKTIRRKTWGTKDRRLSMNEAKQSLLRSIRLTLSTLSCLDTSKSSPSPPPTKIHISDIGLEVTPTPEEKSTTESTRSPTHDDTKRKYSEMSSDESSSLDSETETFQDKVERLGMENSSDDQDFNPGDCSTETSTTTSENEEGDRDVSLTELEDIKKDAEPILLKFLTPKEPTYFDAKKEEKEFHQKLIADENRDRSNNVANLRNEGEFLTPNKFGQDGDTTFYSPISSKSASPERSVSPAVEKGILSNSFKPNDFGNGELCRRRSPTE